MTTKTIKKAKKFQKMKIKKLCAFVSVENITKADLPSRMYASFNHLKTISLLPYKDFI